jgi:Zn ribbon nucleic-acid-binding protein
MMSMPELASCPVCWRGEYVAMWRENGKIHSVCTRCVGWIEQERRDYEFWTWHTEHGRAIIEGWQRA